MDEWGREEESDDDPKHVPPPSTTPETVGVTTLGEGWDYVDDDVPLIDVSSSIVAAMLARVCRERSFFLEREWSVIYFTVDFQHVVERYLAGQEHRAQIIISTILKPTVVVLDMPLS